MLKGQMLSFRCYGNASTDAAEVGTRIVLVGTNVTRPYNSFFSESTLSNQVCVII